MKRALAFAATILLLAACASFDGRGLVPGRSTEDEVVALMGPPSQVLPLPEGGRALYFSRLPEGRMVFEVRVDANGVMRSIEQKLTRQHIFEIASGTSTKEDILRLFGPPGRVSTLSLNPREVWEYKYLDYQDLRILYVQFSTDDVVREVVDLRDLSRDPGIRIRR